MPGLRVELTPLLFQKLGLMKDPEKEKQKQETQRVEDARTIMKAANPRTAIPQPFDAPGFQPNEQLQATRAAYLQSPEVSGAMGRQLTGGQLLDFYKDLTAEDQESFRDVLDRDKLRYYQGEPLEPGREAIVKASLGIQDPEPEGDFDPTTVRSINHLRVLSAMRPDLVPPDMLAAAEQNVATGREVSGIGQDEEGQPFTSGQALNEVQQRAMEMRDQLQNKLYESISKDEYERLDGDEQDRWTYAYKDGVEFYWKERDNSDEIKASIADLDSYLTDFDRQRRSADSLQAAFGGTAPVQATPAPAGAITPEQMAEELRRAGYTDADENDPQLILDYQYWKRMQGAVDQ